MRSKRRAESAAQGPPGKPAALGFASKNGLRSPHARDVHACGASMSHLPAFRFAVFMACGRVYALQERSGLARQLVLWKLAL